MYLDELLKTKWNIERDNSEGKIFVVMKEFSNKTYLHVLWKKIDINFYEKFENAYNIKLLPELVDFYKQFNGCNLFLSSIVIYGLCVKESTPMDFALNDLNKHQDLADKNLPKEMLDDIVFFGGVGEYNLYYKQSEINNPKIYLSKDGDVTPSKIFNSIKDTLEYYLKYLIPEYDQHGYRKHPNTDAWCKKFPLEQNSFWGDITWDIDQKKTNDR